MITQCKSSETARKITGTFLEDGPVPQESMYRWMQQECRSGSLSALVRRFCEAQPERLQPDLVRVESASADGLDCVIPGREIDWESPSPYSVEVRCRIHPAEAAVKRL